jgi:hypothetical protein
MPANKVRLAYQQMARYTPKAKLNDLIAEAQNKKDPDVEVQASMFRGIQDGLAAARRRYWQSVECLGHADRRKLIEEISRSIHGGGDCKPATFCYSTGRRF